ncbi:MAG: N-acetyltransferase family protein [Bacteroidales bacterium]
MRVRPAVSADINSLIEFQMAMAQETEGISLDKKVVKNGITSVLNDIQKARYFVAEMDKEIIGCFMVTPEWSDWRAGYFIWLQSVYVKPAHRGKGVFVKMYDYLKDVVKNNSDYRGIRLYVDKNNETALAVYKKAGMNPTNYELLEWSKTD